MEIYKASPSTKNDSKSLLVIKKLKHPNNSKSFLFDKELGWKSAGPAQAPNLLQLIDLGNEFEAEFEQSQASRAQESHKINIFFLKLRSNPAGKPRHWHHYSTLLAAAWCLLAASLLDTPRGAALQGPTRRPAGHRDHTKSIISFGGSRSCLGFRQI